MSLARKSEDILVGLLVQVAYFGQVPGVLVVLGAALILACILLSGVRKVLEGRSDVGRCVRAAFCLPTDNDEEQNQQEKESVGV